MSRYAGSTLRSGFLEKTAFNLDPKAVRYCSWRRIYTSPVMQAFLRARMTAKRFIVGRFGFSSSSSMGTARFGRNDGSIWEGSICEQKRGDMLDQAPCQISSLVRISDPFIDVSRWVRLLAGLFGLAVHQSRLIRHRQYRKHCAVFTATGFFMSFPEAKSRASGLTLNRSRARSFVRSGCSKGSFLHLCLQRIVSFSFLLQLVLRGTLFQSASAQAA